MPNSQMVFEQNQVDFYSSHFLLEAKESKVKMILFVLCTFALPQLITVFEKSQKCLIFQNCWQLNPNAPKIKKCFRGLFGRCKMRHLG